jgi:crotonobetainyl-CoA:carnitine CoA-transferase CaiB-like acyl-CoA transferase
MSRLGVGYDEIAREKPSIVYCSISAFGQDGPRAREGGFDLTVQAISGVMSVTGEAEGKPAKCGVPISDFCSGLYAAFAIVAAVRKAKRDGVGTHIDCSMLGATLGVAALQTSEYFGNDRDPLRLGSAHPRNAPYQAFGVSNGYVAIAAGNDRLWKSACQAIGRTDLLDDPRFGSISLRARHQVALREILEAEFVRYTAVELLARLTEHGVPCAPVNTYAQALADPQVARMGWVVPLKLPNGALTRTFGFPLRMLGERFDIYRTPPLLGQHTDEVMAELGLRLEDGK